MTEVEWLATFSEELKTCLKERNMTQRELADKSGLAESTISDYVHGSRLPGLMAAINLSYALNMDIGELVDFGQRVY